MVVFGWSRDLIKVLRLCISYQTSLWMNPFYQCFIESAEKIYSFKFAFFSFFKGKLLNRYVKFGILIDKTNELNFASELIFSFVRNPDPNGDLCIYEKPEIDLPRDQYTPCPVKKGSLVIFDGLTIHQSDINRSDKSRFAYTFHVMETDNVKFLPENWIRLDPGQEFERIY